MIPVILDQTYFPEISIRANPEFNQAEAHHIIDAKLSSDIDVQQFENEPLRFFIEHRVKLEQKEAGNVPYFFDVVCITSLTVDDTVPEDERKSIALRAGHAMTYPAIRELIINLTARQPWGQFSIGLSQLQPAGKAAPVAKRKASKTVAATDAKPTRRTPKRPPKANE